MTQQLMDRLSRGPEGLLDFNITLNFGKQWPEMKDFAYETRTQLFNLIYNTEHLGAMVLGFIFGALLVTIIFLAFGRRRPPVAPLATLFALFLAASSAYAQPYEPQVDLVTIPYVDKNFGSKIDGAGMCVFNAFRGCMVSQYREDFDQYAIWLAQHYQGGGYPSRVTEYTRAYCQAKGIQGFDQQYVQVVGEDTIQAIEDALKDGRSVAFTYSGDPSFYHTEAVPHMCNCVYLDSEWMGIVDNNRPNMVEWVRRDVGIKRHRWYDAGWAIIYMGKPQLCRPVNRPPDPPSYSGLGLSLLFAQCPTCGPSYTYPQQQPSNSGEHTWQLMSPGVWGLYRGNTRVGEYHESDGGYYTYHGDGAGRSWLEPSQLGFQRPGRMGGGSSGSPTGVLYGGFPELRRGQTLYGYGSLPIADSAGRLLYQDKVKSDRRRARVVVNGGSDLEARVRAMLKSLGSDAFVYGREAMEVIRQLGYGEGVTVLQGARNGVSVEVGFFRQEPGEGQLRDALMKADPSYRPGGGMTEAIDGVVGAMVIALVALVVSYMYLASQQQKGKVE